MRNRSVMIDFDCHQSLSGSIGRFRLSSVDFEWYQSREGERRRGGKIHGVLFARRRFLPLRGEKKNLYVWGEGMRRRGASSSCVGTRALPRLPARGREVVPRSPTGRRGVASSSGSGMRRSLVFPRGDEAVPRLIAQGRAVAYFSCAGTRQRLVFPRGREEKREEGDGVRWLVEDVSRRRRKGRERKQREGEGRVGRRERG
ncbi:hypothetical protein GW17_00038272 [Ensete ventricosum]|nr:hypothetical protein GW17_00038272 [Ensete ventricosum]